MALIKRIMAVIKEELFDGRSQETVVKNGKQG